MEKSLLNQTWSNDSVTTLQNVNSTMDDILSTSTKDPKVTTLDWAAEKKAMYIIEIVLHCIFLVVGLFGNILTIVVLIFKKWTNITSRHILIALAVADTAMIISHTFNQDFLKDLFKHDVRAISNIGCKIFYVFYRTSKMSSSWFVVFLCFERFLAVKFPHKVKSIITDMSTKIYILVVYLTMASFAIVLSFSSAVESKTCKKDVVAQDMKQVFKALALIEMLLYSVFPIILMSILTPIIILQLFKRYQARNTHSSKSEAGRERDRKQSKEMIRTTTILILVVAAFIICVTPITVFQQVKFWLQLKKKEMETTYSIFVFRETSQRFEQINYSINFFLYIFTSPTFRKTVLEMLHITQNRESTSSDASNGTKLTKIEESQAKQKALPSTSGLTNNIEVTDTEAALDQLESCQTTILPSQGKTNSAVKPEKDQPTPNNTGKSDGQMIVQDNSFTENNCTEKLDENDTIKQSCTAQNDDDWEPVPTYTKTSTDADLTEYKAPSNNTLASVNKDETVGTNNMVQIAEDDQLTQIDSTEQTYMNDSGTGKSSLVSVFTDEQSNIQEQETNDTTGNKPALEYTTEPSMNQD